MAEEQTGKATKDRVEALRQAALESQAKNTAGGNTPAEAAVLPGAGPAPTFTQAMLQQMLQKAVESTTASLTEKVRLLAEKDERTERQTKLMKASTQRMEAQRQGKRYWEIGR